MNRPLIAYLFHTSLILLTLSSEATAADGPPDVDEVSERLDTLWTSDSSEARIQLSVTRSRGTRTLRMKVWTEGTKDALVVIESPAREQGTATLRRDRNLWTYLPRVDRTMRVPPSMMLSSWMGSDFTNDDLTQSASYRRDFHGSIAGPSRDGKGWIVRYEAKEGVVGLWKRIDFIVDARSHMPRSAEYYDRRGRLARTMVFDEVKTLDGHKVPTRLTLKPTDRPEQRTELKYLDIDFDAKLSSGTFSLSALERGR